MNVLRQNFEPFEILSATRTDDHQGGRHAAWAVSDTFDGVAVLSQSAHGAAGDQAVQHANAHMAEPKYSVLTQRSVLLAFHTVIRRVRDGRIFRITSDGTDAKTPKGAFLDLRMFAAEQWRLAGEIIPPEPEGSESNDQS